IHSKVRETLFPDEGPPCWNGLMLWRGARDWPLFLTGKSMIIAGGLNAKAVVYPIAEGTSPATRLTNWAVLVRIGDGAATAPRRGRGAAAAPRGLFAPRQPRRADAARRRLLDPAGRLCGPCPRHAGILG